MPRTLREPGALEQPGTTTATLDPKSADHFMVESFELRVLNGSEKGLTRRSKGAIVVIGTHPSATLALNDETVSRFHCEVEVRDGRVFVRDLSSRNGTLVNGVRVEGAWLDDGATLTLGKAEIRFEREKEPVRVTLSGNDRFGLMVGSSQSMRRIFALLERAAPNDATILLEGETGTGKEVAAESIHQMSKRRDGPFVVVDCGAIPPDLLASELFGHEKGAFTGATSSREGAFEAANGGTIFLDEIGELSMDLQPKLLRVLERKHVKRVGARDYVDVDVRVVAATNRNLRTEVNERRFRADLYYRLAVVEVRIPSVAERTDDLPALVDHLLSSMGAPDDPRVAELRTPAFIVTLGRHKWAGNVRELRNYLERCVALHERAPLETGGAGADPPMPDASLPLKVARERWTRALERAYVDRVLTAHGGNVTAAARAAGVERMYFHRLLQRYGFR